MLTGKRAVRDIVGEEGREVEASQTHGGSEPTTGSDEDLGDERIKEGKLQSLRVKHLTDLWRESDKEDQ